MWNLPARAAALAASCQPNEFCPISLVPSPQKNIAGLKKTTCARVKQVKNNQCLPATTFKSVSNPFKSSTDYDFERSSNRVNGILSHQCLAYKLERCHLGQSTDGSVDFHDDDCEGHVCARYQSTPLLVVRTSHIFVLMGFHSDSSVRLDIKMPVQGQRVAPNGVRIFPQFSISICVCVGDHPTQLQRTTTVMRFLIYATSPEEMRYRGLVESNSRPCDQHSNIPLSTPACKDDDLTVV